MQFRPKTVEQVSGANARSGAYRPRTTENVIKLHAARVFEV